MPFDRPQISKTEEEFDVKYRDSTQTDFVVGPYVFNQNEWQSDECLFLFDFPENLIVIVNELAIPGNVFDYFNPLIIVSGMLSHIKFFLDEKRVYSISGFRIQSKILDKSWYHVVKENIHYPPNYLVNYSTKRAVRSPSGNQIYQILNSINSLNCLPPINGTVPRSSILIEDEDDDDESEGEEDLSPRNLLPHIFNSAMSRVLISVPPNNSGTFDQFMGQFLNHEHIADDEYNEYDEVD